MSLPDSATAAGLDAGCESGTRRGLDITRSAVAFAKFRVALVGPDDTACEDAATGVFSVLLVDRAR